MTMVMARTAWFRALEHVRVNAPKPRPGQATVDYTIDRIRGASGGMLVRDGKRWRFQ